jgi:hypothetical protein
MNNEKFSLIWGKEMEVEFLRNETNNGGGLIWKGGTIFHKGRIVRFEDNYIVPFKKGYFYVRAVEMRPIVQFFCMPWIRFASWVVFRTRKLCGKLKTK